jgi:WD40 repeat protein
VHVRDAGDVTGGAAAGGADAPRESPYKGLIPYSEEDWPFFFGRSAEIRVIAANLRATRLTLLYGPSGVGKSSLLRAGVAHHLEQLADDDSDLRERLGTGIDDPELTRRELAVTIFRGWRDPPLVPLVEKIRLSARRTLGEGDLPAWFPGTPLVDTLRSWTERVHSLLVILDQFEDYFLYHQDGSTDGGFADELARIVRTPDLRVNVLLALREDALAKVDRFKGRIPSLYENYLRVEHLGAGAAREAIVEPVAEYNRRLPAGTDPVVVEDGLVETVLGAMELRAGRAVIDHREVAPRSPLPSEEDRFETSFLQLVMSRLWATEMEQGSRTLRGATLQGLGGPKAIIQGHLQMAMDALSDRERDVAAAVFQFLVTPSKTKIAHTATDLAEWSELPVDEVEAVLQRLCGGDRILRAVEPVQTSSGPSPRRYEIFHDVLADAILDWRARHQERAREAARVARAQEQAERERRRVRRARLVAGGVGLVAGVLAVLAVLAWQARNDAREQREVARSVGLAARSREASGTDPELALLLALRAVDTAPTSLAQEALRQGTNDVRLRTLIPAGGNGAVTRAAVFSPDDQQLVTAGDDGRVAVWNAATGESLRVLVDRGTRLNDVALSPDAHVLATGDTRGFVRVRDSSSGEVAAELQADPRAVNAVAFGPGGQVVATAGASGTVVLWDWRRDRVLARLGEADGPKVWRVAFSPDGRSIAAATDDGRLRIWDVRTRRPRAFDPAPHLGPAYAVAYSQDGRLLASAGDDGTVRVYDLPTGRLRRTFHDHRGFVADVQFSPGGRLIVSTGLDGTILVHDIVAGRVLATLVGHDGSVRRAVFSHDEREVASAGADGTARVWDWAGGAVPVAADRGPVRSVAFSPDGRQAVSLGAESDSSGVLGVAKVWDWEKGGIGQRPTAVLRAPDPHAVANLAGAAFLDRNAIAVAAGTSAAVLRVDDPDARTVLPLEHTALLESAIASPDGRLIVATSVDGHVFLWGWPGGRPEGEISGPSDATSPPPAGAGRTDAAFSPDGRFLVTGDARGNLGLWDVQRRKRVATGLLQHRFITDLAVSPDGRMVAAATDDGIVRLRDARTLVAVGDLVGHTGPVAAVAFAAQGEHQLVVTGGSDGTVRVWDGATDHALVTFRGQQGVIRDVAVIQGGRFIASAADDGTVVVWRCEVCGSIDEVRTTANERVHRRLTRLEEQTYLR